MMTLALCMMALAADGNVLNPSTQPGGVDDPFMKFWLKVVAIGIILFIVSAAIKGRLIQGVMSGIALFIFLYIILLAMRS